MLFYIYSMYYFLHHYYKHMKIWHIVFKVTRFKFVWHRRKSNHLPWFTLESAKSALFVLLLLHFRVSLTDSNSISFLKTKKRCSIKHKSLRKWLLAVFFDCSTPIPFRAAHLHIDSPPLKHTLITETTGAGHVLKSSERGVYKRQNQCSMSDAESNSEPFAGWMNA